VIVLLSVGLGFFNEFRAAVAMSTLRSKISQNATVHRDGTVAQIPVTELVPGDVVTLNLAHWSRPTCDYSVSMSSSVTKPF